MTVEELGTGQPRSCICLGSSAGDLLGSGIHAGEERFRLDCLAPIQRDAGPVLRR
jgi:hypothetical protein